jgi:hypothetical protein
MEGGLIIPTAFIRTGATRGGARHDSMVLKPLSDRSISALAGILHIPLTRLAISAQLSYLTCDPSAIHIADPLGK